VNQFQNQIHTGVLPPRIGIDLGGTKIEIAALDRAGEVLIRRRAATPAGDYAATLRSIASLVSGVEAELGRRCSVGVGTPGALDPSSGLLRNSNSTVLNGNPLARDLESALGREIRIANDANCLALSEAIDGAAQDANFVFAAILGTGVGGGVAVGKRVVPGRNNVAGEWGHNPLPWPAPNELPGPLCYCGKHGCIETFLCGPAFSAEFARATGRTLSAIEICSAAEADDAQSLAALATYEDRLGRALAAVVNLLDPDAIVLGGGLSNVERLYTNVPAAVERYAICRPIDIKLLPARWGDSSGVRGAAWLYS
jgi:fructokinase